jgi:hypothetical protein
MPLAVEAGGTYPFAVAEKDLRRFDRKTGLAIPGGTA